MSDVFWHGFLAGAATVGVLVFAVAAICWLLENQPQPEPLPVGVEAETYEANREALAPFAGQYAVIKGRTVAAPFFDAEDAWSYGEAKYGRNPHWIIKIRPVDDPRPFRMPSAKIF